MPMKHLSFSFDLFHQLKCQSHLHNEIEIEIKNDIYDPPSFFDEWFEQSKVYYKSVSMNMMNIYN